MVSSTITHVLEESHGYLVRLMIVLWVVFGNLGLFVIGEVPNEVIHSKFFSPFLTFYEP